MDIAELGIFNEKGEFKPTSRQEDFLQLPYDIFEGLYGGALGGGKSIALIVLPVVCKTKSGKKQLYQHSQFKGIIFRRTFPQLDKYIIPKAKLIYEMLGAVYNETKHSFTFPSGAVMYLAHMEKDSDALAHDTNEYHYVGIDQAEQFSEFQLRYISSRIRSSHRDLPTIYRMAANPGGISHTYLRDRFVKSEPNGNVILEDKVTHNKRIYIPAKLEDNPYLLKADPDYINRLQLLPESERLAKISGDWFTFTGQVFSEFRQIHIPDEPSHAIHVVSPFTIPEWYPKIIAIDWGWTAKTFALWGAMSPNGQLYIYREYSITKTNIAQWASDIARLSQYDGQIKRIALDPSAWQERGYDLTISSMFHKFSKLIPEKADNDRHSGKLLTHEFLRWRQKPLREIPPEGFNLDLSHRILRMYGVDAQSEYINMFIPAEEEKNLPKLQIFENCKELIEAISICQYDEKDKEDVAEWDGDDPYDTLRYMLKASNIYLEDTKKKLNLFAQQAQIMRHLEETQDQTSFYMQMASLDRKRESLTPKPVKRFH